MICMVKKTYQTPMFSVWRNNTDVLLASGYLGDGEKSVSDIEW